MPRVARRIMGRVPEAILDSDPKADHWFRHLAISIALGICQIDNLRQLLVADQMVGTATGVGLDLLAGSFASVPPTPMGDAEARDFIKAKAFGNRVTVKALRDMLEAVLGYRPVVEEGYLEFTIVVVAGAGLGLDTNWWADDAAPDPLVFGFLNWDYWAGDDLAMATALEVTDVCRVAGVEAKVVLR